MSLRLQINLIIATLMGFFIAALVWLQLENIRRGVREEVTGANRVATQLLSRVGWIYQQSGLPGMVSFLAQLGRVRANDVRLYDDTGRLMYASPPSPYKLGRDAPAWFSELVTPPVEPREIEITGGRLVVHADASRAVLDGWDDMVQLLMLGGGVFVLINGVVFWLTGRALKPMRQVARGLEQMERGDWDTRLPPLAGKEGRLMGAAFNRMAQAVQDSVAAQQAAAEARRSLEQNRELTQLIQSRIEEERRLVARELHDELGQSITAVKSMGLSIAQRLQGKDETAEQAARMIVDVAGRMYDAVHQIIPRLRPFALDRFGLADALDDLAAEWRLQHPGVDIAVRLGAVPADLGDTLSTCAYRIVQEAATNALRHGAPSRIGIEVDSDGPDLVVSVTDNGKGLAPDWRRPGHYGVRGMRERALSLGGSFELQVAEGGGVRVLARLPMGASET